MKKFLLFLFFLGTLFVTTPVSAQEERIREFTSDILVNRDTTIEIKEEIRFQPSTTIPRHGLEWTIPYVYSVKALRRPTELDIEEVRYYPLSNPQNITYDQYSRKDENGWATLRIGDPDRYIDETYVYEIDYVLTYTGISYFDEWEEVYLNVIGPGWNIPIEDASATLTLPANVSEAICYTGPDGSDEQDCNIEFEENVVNVKPLSSLAAYEGYNVVIKQPVGTFENTTKQQAIAIILANIWVLLPIPVGIFLFGILKKKYKNPSITIIPRYEPRKDMDVLTSALILKNRFNTKNISAVLIEMAIQGYYKIREYKKGKYEFVKGIKNKNGLSLHLQTLFDGIFKNGDTVKLKKLKNFYTVAGSANNSALKKLKDEGLFSSQRINAKSSFVILPIITIIILTNISHIFISFSALGLLIGLIGSFILLFIFSFFIDTRSEEGNKRYHEILGLKMYIKTAEKERIKFHSNPKKYKEVFETLLPYAMIFGLEKQWAEQFKDLYKTPPEWYEGDISTFNTVYLANSLSSFNRKLVSSATPRGGYSSSGGFRSGGWSSGSSGFGGGGSSGGGGGGSGGGGW